MGLDLIKNDILELYRAYNEDLLRERVFILFGSG